MKSFENYNEFVKYFNDNCINTESTIKNYHFTEKDKPLFFETWHYIPVYKKSNNIFKKIFNKKDIDFDNCISGYSLNPIIEIETLCPMIDRVDIKYRELDGALYSYRAKPEDIYHY